MAQDCKVDVLTYQSSGDAGIANKEVGVGSARDSHDRVVHILSEMALRLGS
jgi:hypothetical protein